MSFEQLNQILKQVEQLSTDEKLFLAKNLLQQADVASTSSKVSNSDPKNEAFDKRSAQRNWSQLHREEFAGQWVALDGDTLLSHGTDNREVIAQARNLGVKVPFVLFIEPKNSLPLGGW